MNVYNANTDAFTGLPFAEGEFYCFIAVAYAANNSGISAECNNIYQYIESTDAADGDITIQCSTVTVGIEEQNEVSFKMYPNPANSDLIVQMNNIQQVRILNLIGEVVLFEEFSGNSKQKISLEQLSPGIYLVSATNSRGIIRTQRLEIN